MKRRPVGPRRVWFLDGTSVVEDTPRHRWWQAFAGYYELGGRVWWTL